NDRSKYPTCSPPSISFPPPLSSLLPSSPHVSFSIFACPPFPSCPFISPCHSLPLCIFILSSSHHPLVSHLSLSLSLSLSLPLHLPTPLSHPLPLPFLLIFCLLPPVTSTHRRHTHTQS